MAKSASNKLLVKAQRHHKRGHAEAAEQAYLKLLSSQPKQTQALYGLGLLYLQRHDYPAALPVFTTLLQVQPGSAMGHHYMGVTLAQLQRFDEALAAYRKALSIDARLDSALQALGGMLQRLSRHQEATIPLQQALQINRDSAELWFKLATSFNALKQPQQALRALAEVIRIDPDNPQPQMLSGYLFQGMGQTVEASGCFSRALALNPNDTEARAMATYMWRWIGDWSQLEAETDRLLAALDAPSKGVVDPMHLLVCDSTAAQQKRNNTRYVAQTFGAASEGFTFHPAARQKLTIGYLSGDFCDHVVASLVVGLFEAHDREKFNVIGYSTGPTDDSVLGKRVCGAVDKWVDVSHLDAAAAAQTIADDQVDILVDLNGHTVQQRVDILLRRPAPLQVNYLGFSATSGIPTVDYIVVDDFVVPSDQAEHFSEQLVQLPDCYMVTDPAREIYSGPLKRSDYGLPEDGFIFACFNATYKITPPMFAIWMALLAATDGSVLWLRRTHESARENLRQAAIGHGIAPERLVFFTHVKSHAEHMARQALADLCLDTVPYNAHASTADALYVGVPVLTCPGDTFSSRVAGSLLQAVGVPELITDSLAAYQSLALALAHQPERLAGLRQRLMLGCQQGRLFDTPRFTRHLEQAFEMMWQNYLAGQPPQPLVVPQGETPWAH